KMVGDWKVFSLEVNYFLEGVNVDESQNELD
ncbi:PadR family transcriptional regulator, partial [Turicibacter sanguinis]|nr:PadR family transcriptional regulator [Turicibacter sanguinis]